MQAADAKQTVAAKWQEILLLLQADLGNFPEINVDADMDTAFCDGYSDIQKEGQATDVYCSKTRGDMVREGVFYPLVACCQSELKVTWTMFEKIHNLSWVGLGALVNCIFYSSAPVENGTHGLVIVA